MTPRQPSYNALWLENDPNFCPHVWLDHRQNDENIKDQVKKEVTKVIPKIEKLVIDQLESEVLVRSSKEKPTPAIKKLANQSRKLELKKILIDKMEANNSINRSDIQRQLYQSLVDSYEADKILLDTHVDKGSHSKDQEMEQNDEQEPSAETNQGPADQEFETGVQDEQAEEEVQHLPDWFQKPTRLPSPDHAWNTSVPAVHETIQPWLSSLAQQSPFEISSLTELEYFCEEVYKATTEKLDWINPEGRQYPHDLRQPLPFKLLQLGNPVKTELLLKLNLSDQQDNPQRIRSTSSRSVKVLKLKNFKKDATLKLFKNGMSSSVLDVASSTRIAEIYQNGIEIVLGFRTSQEVSRSLCQDTISKEQVSKPRSQ
ncbi:hypothetical protein Tco_1515225 [Tanacetum coccineum]